MASSPSVFEPEMLSRTPLQIASRSLQIVERQATDTAAFLNLADTCDSPLRKCAVPTDRFPGGTSL